MTAARIVLGALGLAAISFGFTGIFTDSGTNPPGQFGFLLTILIANELVLMPIVVITGAAVTRYTPGWLRAPAQVGLYASAVLVIIALPFVLGYGRQPLNPSILPLNYGLGLAIMLAAVWIVAALWAVSRRLRPDPSATAEPPPAPKP